MAPPRDVISFTVKLRLAAVIVVACAAAVGVYLAGPKMFGVSDLVAWRENAKFILAVTGGGVALDSAWYASLSYRSAIYLAEERRTDEIARDTQRLKRERQVTSFQIINALNGLDKVNVRRLVEDIKEKHLSKEQVYEEVTANTDLWKGVISILGEFEDLAIAVRMGYADERVLYDSLKYIAAQITDKLAGYIDVLRERRRDRELYVEIIELVRCWRAGRSLVTQSPWPP